MSYSLENDWVEHQSQDASTTIEIHEAITPRIQQDLLMQHIFDVTQALESGHLKIDDILEAILGHLQIIGSSPSPLSILLPRINVEVLDDVVQLLLKKIVPRLRNHLKGRFTFFIQRRNECYGGARLTIWFRSQERKHLPASNLLGLIFSRKNIRLHPLAHRLAGVTSPPGFGFRWLNQEVYNG